MSEPRRTAEVTYRRAEEADLPRAFAGVPRGAQRVSASRPGRRAIPEDDQQSPTYRHFLRHDGERFWVAEAEVEELTGGGGGTLGAGGRQIVGWGSGLVRGDWWFLSSLFVLPEAQGIGVGGRLFELAATGAPPGAVRATVTDSFQPISNTLYARRGLLPREVLVGFGGQPRPGCAPPQLGTLAPEPLTVASIPELREIDAAASGLDRSVDHEFYLTGGGRHGWLFRRRGRAVAYVCVRPDGWVGPAAAVRERDMETVTACGIADLAAAAPPRRSAPASPAAARARSARSGRPGWSSPATPGLLLSSRPFGRLDRYVVASYGLF